MNPFRLDYDAAGHLLNPAGYDLFLSALQAQPTSDVLFVAHGWLNDRLASQRFFQWFSHGLAPTTVCGVSWPSHPWKSNAAGLVKAGLEMASYYVMKERAATVGEAFGADLRRLRRCLPNMRIHLAGHSFGARLVTSAAHAAASDGEPPFIRSLALIQAAFSQFSFAPEGAFRSVLERRMVDGPIAITHSRHDTAVGQAYPLASRLKGQNASSLGDAGDPYGGLGRNGAQHLTPEECIHLNLGDYESLRAYLNHPVINLNADRLFLGHSDIEKPELLQTLRLLWSRAGTKPPALRS
jgi:pimeloyl-ACP methyl ester carboxylesterase